MGISLSTPSSNLQVSNNHIPIPDDIAFSILSELPIKSLKRFGCVCKSWSLIFDNTYFMDMYRNNLLSKDSSYYDNTLLLLHMKIPHEDRPDKYKYVLYSLCGDKFENRVKLDWPKIDDSIPLYDSIPHGFYISPPVSFDGILFLKSFNYIDKVILWIPTIKEFNVISSTFSDSKTKWYSWVNGHQIGYDHVKNDYKIIRRKYFSLKSNNYRHVPLEDLYYWEIYSLRKNSWKKIKIDMPFGLECHDPVHMDGVSHWWWWDGDETHTNLASFNFSNESFITTPIPYYVDDRSEANSTKSRLLTVLNGAIAFIVSYKETCTFHISILGQLGVMKSWTKLFTVGPLTCLDRLIGVGRKGNILIRKTDKELAWFDLCTGMIDEIGVATKFDCKILFHKESPSSD